MSDSQWNWAGHYAFQAPILLPESIEELADQVVRHEKVRALGTRHCFNDIADSPGVLVSTLKLNHISKVDEHAMTVKVGPGVRYGDLVGPLTDQGYALENLASLPHITVVGGSITATHGSGNQNGCLSTAVVGLKIMGPDGVEQEWSHTSKGEEFNGAVVSLGALGIVTEATLRLKPTFEVKQVVFDEMPFQAVEESFDEITGAGYSVSLFTDWTTPRINQVWVKSLADAPDLPDDWFGAAKATTPRHPVPRQSPINCSEQLGVPGSWGDRLPHFRMDFTPSAGEELQTEYFVPRHLAIPAMKAVMAIGEAIPRALQITEIRMIKADELWMSPFYHQDSVGIHFTWRKDWKAVAPLLPVIEERLAEFGARPHWGKIFHMSAEKLTPRYERYPEFYDLVKRTDPNGKFSNAYLARTLEI